MEEESSKKLELTQAGSFGLWIKVESFWGALAALALIQAFGYIVFQSFLFILSEPDPTCFIPYWWVFIWVLGFIAINNELLSGINNYLSKQNMKTAIDSLKQIDEKIKFIIFILFVFILILFLLGFYPFPKKDAEPLYLLNFYLFSIGIGYFAALKTKKTQAMKVSVIGGKSPALKGVFSIIGIGWIVLSILLISIGLYFQELFYYIGIFGFGSLTILISQTLIYKHVKNP